MSAYPTFTRTTGSTLEQWGILFLLSPQFSHSMPAGVHALSQLGCLDAVRMMHAGGMTSTGLGTPIPQFIERYREYLL